MYAVIDENGTVLWMCRSKEAAIRDAEIAGARAVTLDDGGYTDIMI